MIRLLPTPPNSFHTPLFLAYSAAAALAYFPFPKYNFSPQDLCLECSSQALFLAVSFTSSRSQHKYHFLKDPFPNHLWSQLPTSCYHLVHFLHCTCHSYLVCLYIYCLSYQLEHKLPTTRNFVSLFHGWIHNTWYSH